VIWNTTLRPPCPPPWFDYHVLLSIQSPRNTTLQQNHVTPEQMKRIKFNQIYGLKKCLHIDNISADAMEVVVNMGFFRGDGIIQVSTNIAAS
jgi:hypothetical protein